MTGSPPSPSSGKSKKFMFDVNDFNDDAEEEIEEEEEPPPPTFSEEELAAAKKAGYDDGYNKARTEAENSREKQVVEYCGLITQHVTDLFAQEKERIALYETEVVRLSHAIFKQIFPLLDKKHGLDEVKEIISTVLERHHEHPAITIAVTPEHKEDIEKTIDIRLDAALKENISVTGDDKLGHGDCNIYWNNGGARRSASLMVENIEKHLQQTLEERDDIAHNDSVEDESGLDTALENTDTSSTEIKDFAQESSATQDDDAAEQKLTTENITTEDNTLDENNPAEDSVTPDNTD